MPWPKGKKRKITEDSSFANPESDTTDPGDPLPSSIQFGAVMLEFEMPRLTTSAGKAWSQTARFSVSAGYDVKLESGLVYITHEKGGACIVPIGRVKFFEPLEDKPAAA